MLQTIFYFYVDAFVIKYRLRRQEKRSISETLVGGDIKRKVNVPPSVNNIAHNNTQLSKRR